MLAVVVARSRKLDQGDSDPVDGHARHSEHAGLFVTYFAHLHHMSQPNQPPLGRNVTLAYIPGAQSDWHQKAVDHLLTSLLPFSTFPSPSSPVSLAIMTAHLYSYSDSRLPAHAPHCWTTPSTPGDDEFDFADCEPRQTRTPARGHEVLGKQVSSRRADFGNATADARPSKQMRDLQDNLDELIGITQDQISLSRRDYSRMDRKVDDLASQVQAVLTAVKAPATQFKPLPTLSEVSPSIRRITALSLTVSRRSLSRKLARLTSVSRLWR